MLVNIEGLRSVDIFDGLGDAQLRALLDIADVQEVGENTTVLTEGEAPDRLYIILSGRVLLTLNFPGHEHKSILSLESGEILGWSAVAARGERVASATAPIPTRLLAFRGADLLALCDEDHHLGFLVMRGLFAAVSRRLVETRMQLLDIFGAAV